MNFDDLTKNPNAGLSPALQRARGAMTESTQQHPGMKIWIERGKHLGGFEFFLASGEGADVVFLTEVEPVLTHRLYASWRKMETGGFPEGRYVACDATEIAADGAWKSTKKPCVLCAVLGKPRAITVAKVWYRLDKEIPRSDGKPPIKDGFRSVIFWQEDIATQVLDAATSDIAGGSLIGCRFRVTRSSKDKSARIGDSWVLQTKIDREKLGQLMAKPENQEKINAINFGKAFKPFDLDEQRAALSIHRRWADKASGDTGVGYDLNAYKNYVDGKKTPRLDAPVDNDTPAASAPADSMDDLLTLADIPESAEIPDPVTKPASTPAAPEEEKKSSAFNLFDD